MQKATNLLVMLLLLIAMAALGAGQVGEQMTTIGGMKALSPG